MQFLPDVGAQDAVAFDRDWEAPLTSPMPDIDFAPTPTLGFVGVRQAHSETFALPFEIQHVVRYWRGTCRTSERWVEDGFFQMISDTFLATKGIAGSSGETFAPQFIGRSTTIEHGFEWDGIYDVTADLNEFEINPAYSFDVDPSNGLLKVTPLHLGVVGVNFCDPPSGSSLCTNLVGMLKSALQTTVPATIEKAVHDKTVIHLDPATVTSLFAVPCQTVVNADLATRQQFCAKPFADPNSLPNDFMTSIFKTALAAEGTPPASVEAIAETMTSALEPRNFDCAPVIIPAGTGGCTNLAGCPDPDNAYCELHPVFERVNVLPDRFEFVLAGDSFTPGDIEYRKQVLYDELPLVAAYGNKTAPQFCAPAPEVNYGVLVPWSPSK